MKQSITPQLLGQLEQVIAQHPRVHQPLPKSKLSTINDNDITCKAFLVKQAANQVSQLRRSLAQPASPTINVKQNIKTLYFMYQQALAFYSPQDDDQFKHFFTLVDHFILGCYTLLEQQEQHLG